MTIGVVNFFPLRPHFYNHIFFKKILERDGHAVKSFSCKGGKLDCYYKSLHKKIPGIVVCLNCRVRRSIGELDNTENIYSYNHNIKKKGTIEITEEITRSAKNCYATVNRIESYTPDRDFDHKQIESTAFAIANIEKEFEYWLTKEKIEGVIIFNARMDLFAGCQTALNKLNIPYCTYEASIFGNGCYLYPNSSCLSMDIYKKANSQFINRPLTARQALLASDILLRRINRTSKLEWRSFYNNSSENISTRSSKILILPSSTSENYGDNLSLTNWPNFLDGMEKIILKLGVKSEDVIVRGHPIWGQEINGIDGLHIDNYYKDWCKERGYSYINAQSKIDSKELVQRTEIILINLGTSFIEGAYYNKTVISTHYAYCAATDLVVTIASEKDLELLPDKLAEQEKITKHHRLAMLLRLIYTLSHRLTVYYEEIVNIDILNTKYSMEADSDKLIKAMCDNIYPYNDTAYAGDDFEESKIVEKLLTGKIEVEPQSEKNPENKYYKVDEMINSILGKLIYRMETRLGKGDYYKF